MLWLVIFILLFVIIKVLVLFLKVNLIIKYKRKNSDDKIIISINTFFGLIKYTYKIPFVDVTMQEVKIKNTTNNENREKKTGKNDKRIDLIRFYKKIKKLIKIYNQNRIFFLGIKNYILRHVIIKELKLLMSLGTGDAYSTAILAGALWSLSGIIISFINNNFKVINKQVDVRTEYLLNEFIVDINCIFSFRIVHIIVIAVKFFKYLIKIKKEKKNRR